MKSTCKLCKGEIELVGKVWTHVNQSPRHIAVPDGSKSLLNVVEAIKALREGALVRCLSIEGNPRHDEPDWLCGKPGTNEIWICAVNAEGHFPQHVYSLSVTDVLSTEWVKHAEKSTAWD